MRIEYGYDAEFVKLQRDTEHLEMCGKACTFEHKRDEPEKHKPSNCMICGAVRPVGHVMVKDEDGAHIGRVCSSHSFWEMVFRGGGHFYCTIEWSPDA